MRYVGQCSSEAEQNLGEITRHTTWDDLEGFFEHDSERSFLPIKQDWEEWVMEQANEWAGDKARAVVRDPENAHDYLSHLVDLLVDQYYPDPDIMKAAKLEEITNEDAKKIILKAEDTIEKFGDPFDWDMVPDLHPYAQLYHECFVDYDDQLDELYGIANEDFLNNELAWDDENYTVGAWLKRRGYDTMQEFFFDYSDTLTWPGGGLSGEPFDWDLAEKIADELGDRGLEAVVTGEYHGVDPADRDMWNIEEDTSIEPDEGDAGFEIISAPLEYSDAMAEYSEVVDYLLSNNAYTNDSTGLHINVSLEGISMDQLDYPKLIVMLGDKYVLKQFGRSMNGFAVSTTKQLDQFLQAGQEKDSGKYIQFLSKMRSKVDKALADQFSGEIQFDKYTAIGLKSGWIEFRMAGGTDYLKKTDLVVSTINRFVFAMAVATNPEAYKKEYAKKLYKMAASATGSGKVSDESLKLFALYSSGNLSKEDLVHKLKTLRNKGPKAIIDIELDSMDKKAVARFIKDHYELPIADIRTIIQKAVAWENRHNGDLYVGAEDIQNASEMMASEIVKNLSRDPGFYDAAS